jgi:heme-degrading monooxygenase HmoA
MKPWQHLVIWDFRVKPGMEPRFEEVYGPNGLWARLFETAPEYLGTELTRDSEDAHRYLTLDYWTSKDAYENFRRRNAEQYRAIDAECEAMTDSEVEIGSFARAGR